MKQEICIKKLDGILVTPNVEQGDVGITGLSASFMGSMMSLGYMPTEALYRALSSLSESDIAALYESVVPIFQKMRGAHVEHKPMYPNFPQQVMEASDAELFWNAITHYWSFGEWKPDYEKLPREMAFENIKFKNIGFVTDEDFLTIFPMLLSSNDSLSDEDKTIIEWFMASGLTLAFPKSIPFKENMTVVAGMFLKAGGDITGLVKTATDVLRIVTYLNEGDVSLATNTKFRSMPRSQRRMFAGLLDDVASEEDINRHRSKWVKLFHTLHIGDYSPKMYAIAKKIRNNQRIETYNSRVQRAIDERNVPQAIELLQERPGEYARRLDHLLRLSGNDRGVVAGFLDVANKVPTRALTQVVGHLQTRCIGTWASSAPERVVFPKGSMQKARIIPALGAPLSADCITQMSEGVDATLMERFKTLKPLGKVWIDPLLKECPIPSQQRSTSPGLLQVARGTRMPFGDDKSTLRLFIYWVGQDIDLSATLHDAEFNMREHISWQNMRSGRDGACHSGDVVRAPNGASEFIDIDIEKAVRNGTRYIAMNVLVYSGPTFAEHKECFTGWMTRSEPGSNEIYEAKTVEQKVDLRSTSKTAIPVVFDLVERKAIWCDLVTPRRVMWHNAVTANKATIQQTLKAIVHANKMSLHKLFELHARARGEIVEKKKDAETVFSMYGGVTPYDINLISSEYLA